jgi:hypothetical protein
MNWKHLKERFHALHRGARAHFVMPRTVVELEPDFVVAGRLDASGCLVEQVTVQELPAGAFVPQVYRGGFGGQAELQEALRAAVTTVGNGNGPLGLLVPDGAVRVTVLEFETLPDNAREAEQLVLWRLRDILPFPPEEVRLSYQLLGHEPGAIELLVVGGRNSVLAEYEGILEPLNGGPNLIWPATMSLLPLLPPAEEGRAQLLVHVCAGWMTTVVVAGDRVRFWRNRAVERAAPEACADEVGREVARVQAGCRDHLRLEVAAVWLCARPPAVPGMAPAVAGIVGQEVQPLEPPAGCLVHLSSGERSVCERLGAPLVGLLLNGG